MRTRMRWKRVVSSAVVAVAVGCGCGGDGGAAPAPDVPSMTGEWRGARAELGWNVAVDMVLTEHDDGRFDGVGQIKIDPLAALDGTVVGRHEHPDVSFEAEARGAWRASFDGTFAGDDAIAGLVTTPFFSTPITFALHRG